MKKSNARIDAIKHGQLIYVPETPCARGHLLRSTAGGTCIECRRITEKQRYYEDPAATKTVTAQKYRKHADALRAKRRVVYAINREAEKTVARVHSAEWRINNPHHAGVSASKARYKAANIGKTNAHTAKRRTAKMNRTPAWLTADDLWMIEQAYELAALRTKLFGFSWHVDHVLPLQGKTVSGLHVPNNLQVIPWAHNVSKSNKFLPA